VNRFGAAFSSGFIVRFFVSQEGSGDGDAAPAHAPSRSSSLASKRAGPVARNCAELQPAFAPLHMFGLARPDLPRQILHSFVQGGCQRVVHRLGMKVRPGHRQKHARPVGGRTVPLPFQDHLSGLDVSQALQPVELFHHQVLPGGVGVEAEASKGGFHIRSGMVFWLMRHFSLWRRNGIEAQDIRFSIS